MTDPAQGEPDAPTEPVDAPEAPDLAAEVERLTRESRKWEDRAKANRKATEELEQLRQQHESDQERAVREAAEAARQAVLTEVGADRVADAFRVAAAGRDVDVDELLEGINVAKFLGDDGQPDRDAVTTFVGKLAPEREPAPLDLGQGARGGQQAPGLNSTQLERDIKSALGI